MPEHRLHSPVISWYRRHARDLPWRPSSEHAGTTPWGVLVSEIMLQQTPVNRVLPVWHEWMRRWPTPSALAAEPSGEAIRAWGRLGYPRRALRLHAAAVAISTDHDDHVPEDIDALRALPGIGEYTANAVASFAFHQRHAVVDTNVRRVQARAVTGRAQAAPTYSAAERQLAQSLVPDDPDRAATWAIACMELGALICTARSPDCAHCPILMHCQWQRDGAPEDQGPGRRTQRYEGTDRYIRGLLLGTLRDSATPVSITALETAVPDATLRDPGQRARCLDSLVADGLVVPLARNRFRLPG